MGQKLKALLLERKCVNFWSDVWIKVKKGPKFWSADWRRKKKERKWPKNFIFFQKRNPIILTIIKRQTCNESTNFGADIRWPQKCLNSAAAKCRWSVLNTTIGSWSCSQKEVTFLISRLKTKRGASLDSGSKQSHKSQIKQHSMPKPYHLWWINCTVKKFRHPTSQVAGIQQLIPWNVFGFRTRRI